MEPTEVWVKLRNSTKDSFMVAINKADDIDDLKNAIKAKKNVKVEYVYLEDGEEKYSKCTPDALILSHSQVGNSYEHPFFFTIEPPASGT